MSTEHDVSIVSGMSVIKNLNKKKYDIKQIYINSNGEWYEHKKIIDKMQVGNQLEDLVKIENIIEYIKQLDIVFPVLHGKYGEDGSIQGLLEMCQVSYIGCKVLSSSIGMDKAYAKQIFKQADIKQVEYCYIKSRRQNYYFVKENLEEIECKKKEIIEKIEEKLIYPMFVKPSNSGSSVGINKARNKEELEKSIEEASKYDEKIIIEQGIIGRELECAVLGNEEIEASCIGEIIPGDEFYSFDAKYHNNQSQCVIPAEISEEIAIEIKQMAKKAFQAIDGKGLARVDFFLDENDQIYINEINTMPGFTEISMYTKLWEQEGIEYQELLEKIIQLAK